MTRTKKSEHDVTCYVTDFYSSGIIFCTIVHIHLALPNEEQDWCYWFRHIYHLDPVVFLTLMAGPERFLPLEGS